MKILPERLPTETRSQFTYRMLGVCAFNRRINPNSPTNTASWAQWLRARDESRGIFRSSLPEGPGPLENRLRAMIVVTHANERNHRLGFLTRNAPLSAVVAGPWWFHAFNALEAVVEHGLPVALQRYNRSRCEQALGRIAERRASGGMSQEVPPMAKAE